LTAELGIEDVEETGRDARGDKAQRGDLKGMNSEREPILDD